MSKLKAIFFDHDGTLVDSEKTHYQHWKLIMSEYKINFSLELYIKSFIGVLTLQNAYDLISIYNLNEKPEKLVTAKNSLSLRSLNRNEYCLMPYALEIINFFKNKDILLSVVSGANHYEVKQSIANHNLLKYFEFIVGGDEVEKSKPAPDVYLRAIERLNLSCRECIAIEDAESGVKAAKAAGLNCIAVKTKYSETQDFSLADVILCNLYESQNWIFEKLII